MFDKIKDIADKRLEKITEQLILLDQVEDFPRFVYTEFKDVMKEPYSHIVNLVNSREGRLNNHDIQQWFMNLANKYLQEWLHNNHPEYENKIFVSDHNASTFPSKFRVWYQAGEFKDYIHTGRREICRFDVYEQTYLNALKYETIADYDKSVNDEMYYRIKRFNESRDELKKWKQYQNNPRMISKSINDFFVFIRKYKKVKNNIDKLVDKHQHNYEESKKLLGELVNGSREIRDSYIKCYKAYEIVDKFFKELSYELSDSKNYY